MARLTVQVLNVWKRGPSNCFPMGGRSGSGIWDIKWIVPASAIFSRTSLRRHRARMLIAAAPMGFDDPPGQQKCPPGSPCAEFRPGERLPIGSPQVGVLSSSVFQQPAGPLVVVGEDHQSCN